MTPSHTLSSDKGMALRLAAAVSALLSEGMVMVASTRTAEDGGEDEGDGPDDGDEGDGEAEAELHDSPHATNCRPSLAQFWQPQGLDDEPPFSTTPPTLLTVPRFGCAPRLTHVAEPTEEYGEVEVRRSGTHFGYSSGHVQPGAGAGGGEAASVFRTFAPLRLPSRAHRHPESLPPESIIRKRTRLS